MKTYPKKTKSAYQPRFTSTGEVNMLSSTYAPTTESQKKQLDVTSHAEYTNEEKQALIEYQEKAKWASKSF